MANRDEQIEILRWNIEYIEGRFFKDDGTAADDELGMSIEAMKGALALLKEQPCIEKLIQALYWDVDNLQKNGDIKWEYADHIKQSLSNMLSPQEEQPCKLCGGSGEKRQRMKGYKGRAYWITPCPCQEKKGE